LDSKTPNASIIGYTAYLVACILPKKTMPCSGHRVPTSALESVYYYVGFLGSWVHGGMVESRVFRSCLGGGESVDRVGGPVREAGSRGRKECPNQTRERVGREGSEAGGANRFNRLI